MLDTLRNPAVLLSIAVAVAIFATVLSFTMPLLQGDRLQTRMKAVAAERDKIRARERARLQAEGARGSLRGKATKQYMKDLLEGLSPRRALAS